MKKIYKSILLFTFLIASGYSYAAVFNVTVANFAFTPNSLNVSVGDTIVWTWVSGNHTSTSLSVPPGAMPWDTAISQTSPGFGYVVTTAGTYDYHCRIHASMTGTITATTSGITSPDLFASLDLKRIGNDAYNISYFVPQSSNVKITLFDLTGRTVRVLASSAQPAGNYSETYYMDDMQKGIYLIEFISGNKRLTKRIILD